jgi:hypothetical protein
MMRRPFEYLILTFALTCTLAAGQQPPPARTAPSPLQAQQAPLTDHDIIQMVESGKPEASILTTIRSRRTNFDLSPQGCRLLAAAHVSRTILNAMADPSHPPCASTSASSKPQTIGTGTLLGNGNPTLLGDGSKQTQPAAAAPSSGGGRVALNPQPLPPGSAAKSGAGSPGTNVAPATAAVSELRQPPGNKASSKTTALRPVKLAPPKALRRVTNSLLPKQNASIIAVLQQQRHAADQEASAMKLGLRSPGAAGTIVSQHQTAPSTKAQGTAGVSQLGPERTQAESGSSGLQIVNKPYAEPVSIACAKDPTPRVISAPSVFTPEAKYNLFTINGCGFGATASANSAYIFGGNGFRENLVIDFWSDRGITAHLNPSLAGVLDQSNITLVIAPAGRQAMQKSGFKFYAARGMPAPDGSDQEVPLAYNSMPHAYGAIFNVNNFIAGFDQLPSNATSNFPSFSFQGTPVAGWVFRYAYEHDDRIASLRTADCFINDVAFNGDPCNQFRAIGDKYAPWSLKSDTWDLSKMAPGFQVNSYQLYVSTLDPASLCGSWDQMTKNAYLDGDWDFNLTAQNQIVVTWPVYVCDNVEFGTRDNMMIQSAYGLAVSVMGPRCVDPWTGQRDQSCMTKVQKILGS